MLELIDSHVHLDDVAFAIDRAAIIDRARQAGIGTMIVPATDAGSWSGIRTLCADHAPLFPAYGLHPLYLSQHVPDHVDALPAWLESGDAVAVGEIGLDFHAVDLDRQLQRDFFVRQLELARVHDLPVIVHARNAFEEVVQILRRRPAMRGVVHSFSGSEQQAGQLWKMGFCIGIGGPVTYARARRLRRIVAQMPIEFLLLESDAPDQPDAAHRGQRNEPSRVLEIARCIAELRGESESAIAAATSANARRLFDLDRHG